MTDYFYPRADETPAEPESLLTNAQIRDRYIELREEGKTFKTALNTVISEATGAAVTWPRIVKVIIDELRDERAQLQALNPLDYETAAEFKAAMDAICTVMPTATWIAKLQQKYDITTGTAQEQFDQLKAILLAQQTTL